MPRRTFALRLLGFLAAFSKISAQNNFFPLKIAADISLHCAVAQGNLELSKLLIKHNADITAKNIYGHTPSQLIPADQKNPFTLLFKAREIDLFLAPIIARNSTLFRPTTPERVSLESPEPDKSSFVKI